MNNLSRQRSALSNPAKPDSFSEIGLRNQKIAIGLACLLHLLALVIVDLYLKFSEPQIIKQGYQVSLNYEAIAQRATSTPHTPLEQETEQLSKVEQPAEILPPKKTADEVNDPLTSHTEPSAMNREPSAVKKKPPTPAKNSTAEINERVLKRDRKEATEQPTPTILNVAASTSVAPQKTAIKTEESGQAEPKKVTPVEKKTPVKKKTTPPFETANAQERREHEQKTPDPKALGQATLEQTTLKQASQESTTQATERNHTESKKETQPLSRVDQALAIQNQQAVPPSFELGSLNNPKPSYPNLARSRGWQGDVILGVHVNADGSPHYIEILQSSHFSVLDYAASKKVREEWTFESAKNEAGAIEGFVVVPISFRLNN